MEILPLLHLTGRRAVGLGLVAVIAAGGAASTVSRSAASYEASATMFASRALPEGSNAFDVGPFIADIQAALALPVVLDGASVAAGVERTGYTLTSKRNGDGAALEIEVTGPDGAAASRYASAAAQGSMRFLLGGRVDKLKAIEAQRGEAAKNAAAALTEFQKSIGWINPGDEYAVRARQALEYNLRIADGSNELTPPQRDAMRATVAQLQASLPDLAAKRDQHDSLLGRFNDARAAYDTAASNRVTAELEVEAITAGSEVVTAPPAPVSRLPQQAQAGVAAALAVAGVGVVLFRLADAWRGRRRALDELLHTTAAGAVPPPPPSAGNSTPLRAKPDAAGAANGAAQAGATAVRARAGSPLPENPGPRLRWERPRLNG